MAWAAWVHPRGCEFGKGGELCDSGQRLRQCLARRRCWPSSAGQRVLGTNPNRDEVEPFEEPDPKTWRTIEVEQVKPSGKRLYATLLRPLEWIEEKLDPETNTIDLDLAELGAEGTAKVLRIGPCPPIAAGAGHIVTATFQHEPDGGLLTVTVGNDEIGCTANHPFWSEDRQAFVEAGQLHVGERVRTRLDEVASVVSIKPRPPTAWVYNLEVQGEHVYEVGPSGVLVHNNCWNDFQRATRGMFTSRADAAEVYRTWYRGTFSDIAASLKYHLAKHGRGRTAIQYTRDAMSFFTANRHLATPVILKDGTSGLRIQVKVITSSGTQRIGGYWTTTGKLVTFWD